MNLQALQDVSEPGDYEVVKGMVVVLEASVAGALSGHRCDEVVLDANDVRRLLEMSPRRLQEWVSNLLTKFNPSEPRKL